MRHTWTPADLALLRREYGRTPNDVLARRIGCTERALCVKANRLGVSVPIWRMRAYQTDAALAQRANDQARLLRTLAVLLAVHTGAVEEDAGRRALGLTPRQWRTMKAAVVSQGWAIVHGATGDTEQQAMLAGEACGHA